MVSPQTMEIVHLSGNVCSWQGWDEYIEQYLNIHTLKMHEYKYEGLVKTTPYLGKQSAFLHKDFILPVSQLWPQLFQLYYMKKKHGLNSIISSQTSQQYILHIYYFTTTITLCQKPRDVTHESKTSTSDYMLVLSVTKGVKLIVSIFEVIKLSLYNLTLVQ